MNADLLRDVLKNLSEFKFVERQGWLRQGVCPGCQKKELYTHAEDPWVLRCGRLTNCGYEAHIKDLYPDLFDNWSDRYQVERDKNPNATADAYLAIGRGFDLDMIKGSYSQEHYHDSKRNIGSATVRFHVSDTWWERLIDQPSRFGKQKARFKYKGSYRGQWWTLPGVDLKSASEIWLVEGIFDAIALAHHGITAVALLTCSNYPEQALADLLLASGGVYGNLVWAQDGDAAGRRYIKKFTERARAEGWTCRAAVIPQGAKGKRDWNDLHLLDRGQPDADKHHLSAEGLKTYLYHGALLTAESASAKALLMYSHDERRHSFEFEFGKRLYWFELDVDKFNKATERIADSNPNLEMEKRREEALAESGGIRQIANCWPYPLYYQANKITDESWYYYRIEFPHDGQAIKNTFTSAQLSGSGEFKKRLLAIAPGAMFSGTNLMLDRSLERQLYNIKRVETVDFVGYSKAHGCYILGDLVIAGGKIHRINNEDYFDLGRLSVKTLSQSVALQINDERSDYDKKWVDTLWQAFGAKGLAALTFWFGSLFSEQIRASQKSYPFLEIVGEAGSGKTTLIEFLWKTFGRSDYEGFDPSKSTAAGRARNFAQVSAMPVVLIESDREQSGDQQSKVRSFDWDELKTAYNGRSVRSRGMATSGNETYEPPFRGAIVISQNNQVQASDAVMTRITHLYFDRSSQSSQTRVAAKLLEQMPTTAVSGFILAATTREAVVMQTVDEKSPIYEQQFLKNPDIRTVRIAKCHGQLMALADALRLVVQLTDEQHTQLQAQIQRMALEREQAIDADHPMVNDFWDMYDYLNGDDEFQKLNHSRKLNEIAINLNHVLQVAVDSRQQMPPLRDLKMLLKTSKRNKYMGQAVVNSAINSRQGVSRSQSERCWIFTRGVRNDD